MSFSPNYQTNVSDTTKEIGKAVMIAALSTLAASLVQIGVEKLKTIWAQRQEK